MDQELVIRRRAIAPADWVLIRQLIEAEGARGRSHLSNRLCELWDWRQANGRYRQIACRELLRRLQSKGLIGAYHYLGYQQATGAQLKYLLWYSDRPIACLSFGPAAWKLAPRDHYIGWSAQARQARLNWVVNNDRFLIVPGVQIRHLASSALGASLRRLRTDWQAVYGHDLALAETFIEADRFRGRCYAAANWVCVGQTQGRGRNDRTFAQALPVKTVWVYPLRADFRSVLGQEA
jgi:hypothetical protein